MKKLVIVFVAFIIIIVLYFTFSDNSPNLSPENSSDATPQHGGTMIIGITGDVDSFNPLFGESVTAQEISHLMLLGLADLNDKSDFAPELAESWESSEDYLKLTFRLRKDMFWSDGMPITAEDVKFTWELLKDPTLASPRQGYVEYVKEVKISDPHTIVFEFTEAYPAQIFDVAGEILPKHIFQDVEPKDIRNHEFSQKPISSGPFKLNKWVSQQYIEIVPNEKYFGDKPYLEKIIFKIVPDATNLLLQLESGKIDMMMGIPVAEIERLKENNRNIEMHQVSGRVYYYIGYNILNDLFKDPEIRRSLTMAIDTDKIIESLLYGYGSKCLGPLPPIVEWAYNEDVQEIKYDPSEAKKVLFNEGWSDSNNDGWIDKDGKNFEFTLTTPTGNQIKADLAVIVQEQLKKAGIKVNIKMLEWTTFLDHLQKKDFDACVGGLSSSYYIDPTPVFHSSATNMFNSISYSNPKVDELIEKGRVEMDRQKAAKIWKEFQQTVYNDQPFTFLFWRDKVAGVNKEFKNVTPIALSSVYNLEKWHKVSE